MLESRLDMLLPVISSDDDSSKLLALDEEDAKSSPSQLQDAVVRVGDMTVSAVAESGSRQSSTDSIGRVRALTATAIAGCVRRCVSTACLPRATKPSSSNKGGFLPARHQLRSQTSRRATRWCALYFSGRRDGYGARCRMHRGGDAIWACAWRTQKQAEHPSEAEADTKGPSGEGANGPEAAGA